MTRLRLHRANQDESAHPGAALPAQQDRLTVISAGLVMRVERAFARPSTPIWPEQQEYQRRPL